MPSLSPVTAAVSAPLPVCPEPGCDHLLELANGAILIRAAETGHIQFWNSAAARLYGWSADDAVGQVAHTLLQTRLPVPASEIEARLAVEDRWAGEVRQVRRDGTEMVVHTRWSVRRDPGGAPLAILELNDDVTESRRSAEELRLLHAVLLDIGESDNLTAAYRAMLECIGEVTNWAVGLAWVPDDTGQQLQLGALWPESTGSCAARLTRFRQTTFRPAEGLVGQVWATGRPIWLRDVSAESAYARARAAAEVGLKAGLLVPVLADDEVVAVLEFLTPAARDEDERLVRTVTAVAAQLGAAIRRKRARAEVAYLRRQTDVAERRLATLVEAAPDAIVIFDAEGRIQLVNRSAETMFGYGCEELAAQAVESLMPGLRQAAPAAIHRGAETARLADAGGRELAARRRDGGELPVEVRLSPTQDAGQTLTIAIVRDISERVQARANRQFLVEASTLAAESFDSRQKVEAVLRLAVPRLATCAVLDLDDGGRIERLAVLHANPAKQPLADALRRYPPVPHQAVGTAGVLEAGQAQVLPDLTDAVYAATALDEVHLELLRQLGFRSALSVPLRARGRTLGAITLLSDDPRRQLTDDDLPLAQAFAQRLAIAVDNVKLYTSQLEAREDAEVSLERVSRLQALTAALAEAATPRQVAEAILGPGLSAMKARSGAIFVPPGDGDVLQLLAATGYAQATQDRWRAIPVAVPTPITDAMRTGEAVWLESPAATWARYPRLRGDVGPEDGARVAVPLVTRGRRLGVLAFSFPSERKLAEIDRTFVTLLARQAAQALDRAELFEAERLALVAAQRLASERELILSQIADGVLVLDPEGHVSFANAAARRLFGVDETTPWGLPEAPPFALLDAAGAPLSPGERPLLAAVRRGETVLGRELQVRRGDGTVSVLLASAAPIRAAGGDLLGGVLTFHDNTAQAEAERQKGEFFDNISHDLRTPLTAIKASIGVVLSHEAPGTPQALHRMFQNIDLASDRMIRLVDDLLEMTRIQAGRLHLERGPRDLREVIVRAARLTEPLLAERALRLQLDLPAQPVLAQVDGERLGRAVLNLLANAQKYAPIGGTIGLDLSHLAHEARIAVHDDGPGIPAMEQARIFERFYRSPDETTRRSPGSGLGLPIARAMVELHGGRIWVESGRGAGTTFHIAVPAAELPAASPNLVREAPPD